MGISWWTVFLPAWLGDAICVILIILSWFGSCPYIQLCLHERQARLGDTNPSILTEILPDIVMGILALVFMILALVAELLLCRYLNAVGSGEGLAPPLAPCGIFFLLVSLLVCCRGVCIRTSGELFNFIGGGALATTVAALCLPDGPLGKSGWVLLVPWIFSAAGLFGASLMRLRRCRHVLSREELLLRRVEQVLLLGVSIALLVLVLLLAPAPGLQGAESRSTSAGCGIFAGSGVCIVALLRSRMAIVEHRSGSIRERIMAFDIRQTGRSAIPAASEAREMAL